MTGTRAGRRSTNWSAVTFFVFLKLNTNIHSTSPFPFVSSEGALQESLQICFLAGRPQRPDCLFSLWFVEVHHSVVPPSVASPAGRTWPLSALRSPLSVAAGINCAGSTSGLNDFRSRHSFSFSFLRSLFRANCCYGAAKTRVVKKYGL